MKGPEGLNLSLSSQSETQNRSEVTELPTKKPDSFLLLDTKRGCMAFSLLISSLSANEISQKHYADWRPITAMITSVLGKEEHIKRHKNVRTHAHTVLRMYYLAACINSCWTAERALQVVCNTADHSGEYSRMQSISRYISAKYAYIKRKLCHVSLHMATHTCALI